MKKANEFQEGALVAIGILFKIHDAGVQCADLIKEMQLDGIDCSGMDDYDKENLKALNHYENAGLKGL